MHCKLSRTRIVRSLALGLTVGMALTTTGCKMGGWGSSSWSSPSWMAWGKKDAPSTAGIASTKPSTTLPSSAATPSPTTSVAASTPGSSTGSTTASPSATSTAAASYPTTSQAYSYPTQPAAAYQASNTGTVAPTGGYSAGPYSMTSGQSLAPQQSPYAPSYSASGYAAAPAAAEAPASGGQSWNSTPAYTADQRSATYGSAEPSPYSSQGYGAPQMTPASNQPAPAPGGYNQGGYSTPGYTPAGAPPSGYGQPQSYQAPAAPSGYEGQHVSNVESNGYASAPSANTAAGYGAPAGTQATASPASYQPALPASLAPDQSGYRPGSTGRTVGADAGTTASGSASYGGGGTYR